MSPHPMRAASMPESPDRAQPSGRAMRMVRRGAGAAPDAVSVLDEGARRLDAAGRAEASAGGRGAADGRGARSVGVRVAGRAAEARGRGGREEESVISSPSSRIRRAPSSPQRRGRPMWDGNGRRTRRRRALQATTAWRQALSLSFSVRFGLIRAREPTEAQGESQGRKIPGREVRRGPPAGSPGRGARSPTVCGPRGRRRPPGPRPSRRPCRRTRRRWRRRGPWSCPRAR